MFILEGDDETRTSFFEREIMHEEPFLKWWLGYVLPLLHDDLTQGDRF